jgi:hypothetical protein
VPEHLAKRVQEIENGQFKKALDAMTSCSNEEIRKKYTERVIEPE